MAYENLLGEVPWSVKRLKYSPSAMVLLAGSKKKYPNIAHHNIHFGKDWKGVFDDLIEKEQYRYKATTNPLRDKMPNNPNEIIFGLDLSHHQRHINWKKVAQNPPHFILFKATEGSYRNT